MAWLLQVIGDKQESLWLDIFKKTVLLTSNWISFFGGRDYLFHRFMVFSEIYENTMSDTKELLKLSNFR